MDKQITKRLQAELKKRQKVQQELPKFVLEDHCFDKQLAFISDPSKFKTAYCSRRAGKTEACSADLFHTALSRPNTNSLYITLSRKSAKRIIWRSLLALNKKYQTNAKIDNVELTLEFPNGSMIYCSGAKDLVEIDKFRGMALVKVYIDEAQSFKSYLRELIDDVVEPALYDYDGSLAMIGTPNASCSGAFHDACHQKEGFVGWSNHRWTILDNPWIKIKSGKTPQEMLAATLKRKGITASNPSYRRESLGEWVYDIDSLMYKYDPKRNLYDELPEGDWHYILGCDIGFKDKDALAVLAYSKKSPQVYLVEEWITGHQDISSLVDQIKILDGKYQFTKRVMDAGGLGKKIQEEIRQRHGIHMDAAEKHRKAEFIELLNDDLRTSKLLVKHDMTIVEDWGKLEWDKGNPDKWKEHHGFHSDIADAVLYAWREAKHYGYEPPKDRHHSNSNEYADEQERLAADKMARDQANPKEFWEDGFNNDRIDYEMAA